MINIEENKTLGEASVETDGRRPFPSPEFYSSVASNIVDFLTVDTDEKIAKLTETVNHNDIHDVLRIFTTR